MSEYSAYLRLARRKHADPESLVASAASDLTPRQLAQLVSVLVDRHDYRPPKAVRDPLIDALLADDLGPTRIAGLLGCHRRTVARRQAREVGSTNGSNKRRERDKTRRPYHVPALTFSAAGGGSDVRTIRDVLRAGRRVDLEVAIR